MRQKTMICKTCGAEIAKSAHTCPKCGARQHTSAIIACILVIVLVIVAVIAVLSSNSNQAEQPVSAETVHPTAEPEPISVSAEDLWAAYDENAVNADSLYKNQLLALTGEISNIGQDLATKSPCVSLRAGDPYGIYSVQCFFSDKEAHAVAELRDGQTVTIIGRCNGATLSIVQLTQCTISAE